LRGVSVLLQPYGNANSPHDGSSHPIAISVFVYFLLFLDLLFHDPSIFLFLGLFGCFDTLDELIKPYNMTLPAQVGPSTVDSLSSRSMCEAPLPVTDKKNNVLEKQSQIFVHCYIRSDEQRRAPPSSINQRKEKVLRPLLTKASS